ncbi:MAG: hypothetical protein MJ211_02970 [Bacteroidales bacterium]|nr:hypothetical protein [Bacteroidales bacterium]
MKKFFFDLFIVFTISLLPICCRTPEINENIKINSDSTLFLIKQIGKFTNRFCGTENRDSAMNFIFLNMKKYSDTVYIQTFDCDSLKIHNIIGKINPQKQERILLYTNYDQNPEKKDSIDYNSAIALLITLSKTIKENPIDKGFDIIFFDGRYLLNTQSDINHYLAYCQGSQLWTKNYLTNKNINYEYGMCLVNPTSKGTTFITDGNSNHFASKHLKFLKIVAQKNGLENLFSDIISRPYYGDNTIISSIAGIRSVNLVGTKIINEKPEYIEYENINDINNQEITNILKIILETLYTNH